PAPDSAPSRPARDKTLEERRASQPPSLRPETRLLELDRGAGFLELRLDRVGFLLGDPLLDRIRGSVDEVLRLLEPEARPGTDDLDHLDLLVARAGEDDVEGGLLLSGRCAVTPRRGCRARSGDRDRGGRRDAPFVLDLLLEFDELKHRHLAQLVEQLVDSSCSHHSSSFADSSPAASPPF